MSCYCSPHGFHWHHLGGGWSHYCCVMVKELTLHWAFSSTTPVERQWDASLLSDGIKVCFTTQHYLTPVWWEDGNTSLQQGNSWSLGFSLSLCRHGQGWNYVLFFSCGACYYLKLFRLACLPLSWSFDLESTDFCSGHLCLHVVAFTNCLHLQLQVWDIWTNRKSLGTHHHAGSWVPKLRVVCLLPVTFQRLLRLFHYIMVSILLVLEEKKVQLLHISKSSNRLCFLQDI